MVSLAMVVVSGRWVAVDISEVVVSETGSSLVVVEPLVVIS